MSLKIWLPLDGDLHNQGCSNIQATVINGTVNNNGKIGQCYYLDSSDRIYSDLFTPISNNFSLCCWYKSEEENTSSGYIFGLSRASEPSLMLYKNGTTGFRIYINSYSSYTHEIDITQWHHLALTYNGSECKLYIDGKYKITRAQTIDYTSNTYRCFLNCRSNNNNTNGTGNIYAGKNYYNDFRYYDHCLSAAEIHEISMGLILHYKLNGIFTDFISDSSGYGYNGTCNESISLTNNTPKYNNSTFFNGNSYVTLPIMFSGARLSEFTWSGWIKDNNISNTAQKNIYDGIVTIYVYNGNTIRFTWNHAKIDTTSANTWAPGAATIQNSVWTHIAFTFKDGYLKFYINGEHKGNSDRQSTGQFIYNYRGNQLGSNNFIGSLSDIRIYTTSLLDNDIKMLYNLGMKIDKIGGLHTYEIEETPIITDTKLTKTGILKSNNIYENGYLEILHYDKTIYTEPDDSTWVRVMHHNNPANNLFSSSGSWATGYYIDADRWYDLEQILPNLIKYEFMVKQKTTSNAVEKKWRWIQTINPIDATFNDVSSDYCVYNSSAGYSTSDYNKGMYCRNDNERMCIADDSSTHWYGGIGAWSTYNGGIPGYPKNVVTTGYIDLYVRIYIPAKIIKNQGFSALHFIEA